MDQITKMKTFSDLFSTRYDHFYLKKRQSYSLISVSQKHFKGGMKVKQLCGVKSKTIKLTSIYTSRQYGINVL